MLKMSKVNPITNPKVSNSFLTTLKPLKAVPKILPLLFQSKTFCISGQGVDSFIIAKASTPTLLGKFMNTSKIPTSSTLKERKSPPKPRRPLTNRLSR